MSGSYVPPHLRKKALDSTRQETVSAGPKTGPPKDLFTLREIHDYFWECDHAKEFQLTDAEVLRSTLHDSRKTPGKLAFAILFEGANPRWKDDQILFTKSRLELLPDEISGRNTTPAAKTEHSDGEVASSATASEHNTEIIQAVAIFKQTGSDQNGRSFTFDGWYKISLIDYLEPNSPELVRMLEQKWTRTRGGRSVQEQRSSAGWQKSLALRWAVVKFAKDEAVERERGAPEIEQKHDEPNEKKGVNELLAELRVKDVTNQGNASTSNGKAKDESETGKNERSSADSAGD